MLIKGGASGRRWCKLAPASPASLATGSQSLTMTLQESRLILLFYKHPISNKISDSAVFVDL